MIDNQCRSVCFVMWVILPLDPWQDIYSVGTRVTNAVNRLTWSVLKYTLKRSIDMQIYAQSSSRIIRIYVVRSNVRTIYIYVLFCGKFQSSNKYNDVVTTGIPNHKPKMWSKSTDDFIRSQIIRLVYPICHSNQLSGLAFKTYNIRFTQWQKVDYSKELLTPNGQCLRSSS